MQSEHKRQYAKLETRICCNEKCRRKFKARRGTDFCSAACRVENHQKKIMLLISLIGLKLLDEINRAGLSFERLVWAIKNDLSGAYRVADALGYEWSNYGQVWRKKLRC